ncbi:MAG TPA: FtsX-like permease family protein [Patescibacteria group bacterium]|nr:FtsX-like permease family protein [Patescibacteria group bacterium]
MMIIKLAFRNLIGAGLRTWLNVFVLSLAFVVIIWTQGFIEGMNRYAMSAKTDAEVGGGQYWHRMYDPYDPLTLEDSHALLSPALAGLVERGDATPILVTTGAIYPEGRVRSVLLKGIDPEQDVLNLPTGALAGAETDAIPALIGAQTAEQTKLAIGDYVTVRWRDVNGTFDADDIRIAQIMHTTVPSVDQGQIWIPIQRLRGMLQAPEEATLVVLRKGLRDAPDGGTDWIHRTPDYLLSDIRELVKMKSASINILYGLLLLMGLLAIFDTQVLSIWRRRKEIGTLMALGMERIRVIVLFTFEGALHGLFALAIGAVYGIPILALTLRSGLSMPEMAASTGVAVPEVLYPHYGFRLVLGTTVLVLIAITVVSYLPATKIARLKPTEALRGKRS